MASDALLISEKTIRLSGTPFMQILRSFAMSLKKGSIAIDGISLTVAAVEPTGFSVSTIPHTVRQTNLNQRHKGDFVNLETDVVGKYIERLLPSETPKQNTLTKEMLLRCGF